MAVERVPLDAREPGDVAQRRARRALRAVELDRRLDDPPPRLLLLLGASLQLVLSGHAEIVAHLCAMMYKSLHSIVHRKEQRWRRGSITSPAGSTGSRR